MKRIIEIADEPKYFYCRYCGCLFEADKHDYIIKQDEDGSSYVTACPSCGHKVYKEVKK